MGKGIIIFIFLLAGAIDSHSQAITQVIRRLKVSVFMASFVGLAMMSPGLRIHCQKA